MSLLYGHCKKYPRDPHNVLRYCNSRRHVYYLHYSFCIAAYETERVSIDLYYDDA